MTEKLLLIENDIWDLLEKQVKPEFITADSWKVKFLLYVDDKLYKELDDDPLLLQQMTDVGSNHYNRIVREMRKALTEAEKDARLDSSDKTRRKLMREINAEFERLANAAEKMVEKDAMAVVNRWKKVNTDKTLDKIQIGSSVVGSLAGLAAGIVTLATTPFTGGVGGIVGIIGLMRSVSRLAGIAHDYAQDVDKLIKSLQKDLKELAADFTENNKKAKAADLAKEAFNAVIFPANVLKSVNTVARQVGVVQRKLRTMEIELHKLAKDVNRGLNACDKGGKELDRILKEVGGNKDLQVPLNKAAAALEKSQKSLMKTIGNISSGQTALDQRMAQTEELAKFLDELSNMRGKALKIIEFLIRYGTILTSMELAGVFKEVTETAVETFGGVEALQALQSGPLKDVL